jgi:hypothetical protein
MSLICYRVFMYPGLAADTPSIVSRAFHGKLLDEDRRAYAPSSLGNVFRYPKNRDIMETNWTSVGCYQDFVHQCHGVGGFDLTNRDFHQDNALNTASVWSDI